MFLLGAGASKPFGMKLARELFCDFFRKAPDILTRIYPPYWRETELPQVLKMSQNYLEKTPTLDYLLCGFNTGIPLSFEKTPPWRDLRKKLEHKFNHNDIRRFEVMLQNSVQAYLIAELFQVKKRKKLQKKYSVLFDCFGKDLDIFTTNYDLCVETYCRKNGLKWHRGFVPIGKNGKAVRKVSFTPRNLDKPGVRLHKFYGSVNLGFIQKELVEITDLDKYIWQNFFMLAGPMIYDIYWRSFYLRNGNFKLRYAKELLSRFGKKLMETDKLVIVGHSFSAFEDPIVAAIRAAVKEKKQLKLYVLDPSPEEKRIQKILDHSCRFLQCSFCEESIKKVYKLWKTDC